jgi:hypothetical protein
MGPVRITYSRQSSQPPLHGFEAQVPPMGHRRGWERSDGCEFSSKKRYRNREAAEADIARLRGQPGSKPIRAYSGCPCGGWHTTSQEDRVAVQESATR